MKVAPLPPNELNRLLELRKFNILDSEPEQSFDTIVKLASYICQTPIAAISLVDEHRQWFKSIVGVDAKETSRDVAFCAHAILQEEPLVVPNALDDERFFDNPLVAGDLGIRFYAGVALVTTSGHRIGTLCVIDQQPRELSAEQMTALQTLADNVMALLNLRMSNKQIRKYAEDLELAASIFQTATEAMLVTDEKNRIITVNPAFSVLTGYPLQEVIGKNPAFLSSGTQGISFYEQMWQALDTKGHWEGELWNKRKDGELYAEWLSINVLYHEDGSKRMHVGIFSDITEKKRAEEIIWTQANYDHLTQLPNRRLFRDRLEHEIKMAHRTSLSLALLFIDLDLFKQVNDTYGHDVGDALLVQVAQRLTDSVRESDTVARMGGDEFTAILPQLESAQNVERVAQTIIDNLSKPFNLDSITVQVSASIGVAVYPVNGQDAVALLKLADSAMYAAKTKGRNQYCVAGSS